MLKHVYFIEQLFNEVDSWNNIGNISNSKSFISSQYEWTSDLTPVQLYTLAVSQNLFILLWTFYCGICVYILNLIKVSFITPPPSPPTEY